MDQELLQLTIAAMKPRLTLLLFRGELTCSPLTATAVVPEFTVTNGAVRIQGIDGANPIIYDNDWWFDMFDNNYLWAQASLGKANFRGNIVSRDMWDWRKGYHYWVGQSWKDSERALALARASGLENLPDLTRGADRVLARPENGRIEDTLSRPRPGRRLIVAEAQKASPEKPLVVGPPDASTP